MTPHGKAGFPGGMPTGIPNCHQHGEILAFQSQGKEKALRQTVGSEGVENPKSSVAKFFDVVCWVPPSNYFFYSVFF